MIPVQSPTLFRIKTIGVPKGKQGSLGNTVLLSLAPAKGSQQGDSLLSSSSTGSRRRVQNTFQWSRGKQGNSYLQRWSALSNKGVSFSKNSKAQLTSSVKSYRESEASTWVPGCPDLPQPTMQAYKDTLVGMRA